MLKGALKRPWREFEGDLPRASSLCAAALTYSTTPFSLRDLASGCRNRDLPLDPPNSNLKLKSLVCVSRRVASDALTSSAGRLKL